MAAQLQHGVKRFRRRAVFRARAGCPATPETGPACLRQRLHSVSPPFRSTAPIGRRRYRTITGGFVVAAAAVTLRRGL
jgi:hypothetical protein